MHTFQKMVTTPVLLIAMSLFLSSKEVSGNHIDHFEVDNHNKIYHSFPLHPRVEKPEGEEIKAGECCMLFDHVEVPVGSSASFHSPEYPKSYPSDMICGWNFTTDPGYTFDMHCHFANLKRNDIFTMWDFFYNIQSYIENVRDEEVFYYFRSNDVQVGFHSDDSISGRGFECTIWPVKGHCAFNQTLPHPKLKNGAKTFEVSTVKEIEETTVPSIEWKKFIFMPSNEVISAEDAKTSCDNHPNVIPNNLDQFKAYVSVSRGYEGPVWAPIEYEPGVGFVYGDEVIQKNDPRWMIGHPRKGVKCVSYMNKKFMTSGCDHEYPYLCAIVDNTCEEGVVGCFKASDL